MYSYPSSLKKKGKKDTKAHIGKSYRIKIHYFYVLKFMKYFIIFCIKFVLK